MNQFAYISQVMSNVHESVEGWARDLLRTAGLETTEVYGQFPPEGSVASHVVLFPYRMGGADSQIATPIGALPDGLRAQRKRSQYANSLGYLGELLRSVSREVSKMTKDLTLESPIRPKLSVASASC